MVLVLYLARVCGFWGLLVSGAFKLGCIYNNLGFGAFRALAVVYSLCCCSGFWLLGFGSFSGLVGLALLALYLARVCGFCGLFILGFGV